MSNPDLHDLDSHELEPASLDQRDRGGIAYPVFIDAGSLGPSIRAALDALLAKQHATGYWVGELEADCSLEADAVFLEYYLGAPNAERVRKLVNTIEQEQGKDG